MKKRDCLRTHNLVAAIMTRRSLTCRSTSNSKERKRTRANTQPSRRCHDAKILNMQVDWYTTAKKKACSAGASTTISRHDVCNSKCDGRRNLYGQTRCQPATTTLPVCRVDHRGMLDVSEDRQMRKRQETKLRRLRFLLHMYKTAIWIPGHPVSKPSSQCRVSTMV